MKTTSKTSKAPKAVSQIDLLTLLMQPEHSDDLSQLLRLGDGEIPAAVTGDYSLERAIERAIERMSSATWQDYPRDRRLYESVADARAGDVLSTEQIEGTSIVPIRHAMAAFALGLAYGARLGGGR